ncbi:transposase [Trichonephila clavipes]|nr:transposase [Trichonephila clavipes]
MPNLHLTHQSSFFSLTRRDPKTDLCACPLEESIWERKGNGFQENLVPLQSKAVTMSFSSLTSSNGFLCALLVEWLPQQTKLPHLSEANPQVYVETPLHPEKLTVWCALWAGGILLQNDEGHKVTVNGDRYRAMITNFFIPELSNHDVQELWFQQHGATCHTARATIDLLKDTFGDRLISRFGPVNWPDLAI